MADKKQIVESTAFKNQKAKYGIWGDFCTGGETVEGKTDYLPQHPYETEAQYKLRQSMSTYKNHAKPIVSVFSSSVWRKKPIRELPPGLEDLVGDVDTFGTSVDMFFRFVTQKSAETGVFFVLVDSTKAPEDVEIKTQKDSKIYNIRPYLVAVPALSVISWGFDDTGLSFLVIKEDRKISTGPFTEPIKGIYYQIWSRVGWEFYKETDKEGLILDSSGVHPCGEVPVIPCYFKKKAEIVGDSAISDVTSLLSRAYNMENALDKSLFDTAFPQQAFYGFDADSIKEYIRASSNGLCSSDPGAKSEFVEPEGRAFEALEKKVKNDELSIKEIALRMLRSDSKVGESAEAKKIDNQQFTSQLSVFSQNCQETETRCWALMQKWLGGKADAIEIKYHTDFDVERISGDLIKAFSEMRRNKDLSRETFWKIMQNAEVPFPENFNEGEETERLTEELRSAGTMGELGSRFLTGTGV